MYQPACLKFSVFIQLIVPHLHFPILWPLSLARYDSRRGKKVFLPCVFGNRERNRKEKKDMLFLLLCLDKVKKATKFYRQKSNFRVFKVNIAANVFFNGNFFSFPPKLGGNKMWVSASGDRFFISFSSFFFSFFFYSATQIMENI